MITDVSSLSQLNSLQELYLSHNLLSSLLIKYSDHNETIWPNMEVIDITSNKLNDFYEILHLLNGTALRRDVIKVIAIKGNCFYN